MQDRNALAQRPADSIIGSPSRRDTATGSSDVAIAARIR